MNVHWCTLMCIAVAGCATAPVAPLPPPEPVVRTVTVDRIVSVPCVAAIPAEPAYPASDAALAALTPDFDGAWTGIALLKGEIAVRKADQDQLRGVLGACIK